MYIKIYHSFGSQHNAIINGHVLKKAPMEFLREKTWFWTNLGALVKLFRMRTIPHVALVAEVFNMHIESKSDDNGYFEFEFDPYDSIPAGWHAIKVYPKNNPTQYSMGEIFVPYVSSYGIISDIDDTVLKSYSATFWRKIYELLSKNPHERKLFDNTVQWYKALAKSYPRGAETNPFFYVSSSEWNLYEYLHTVFKIQGLPKGIFLLNSIKSLKGILKTGKTGHDGKLDRIKSLIKAFPEQEFVLIGDNTQQDPYIYQTIAQEYPKNVKAVFIRNKKSSHAHETQSILNCISKNNIPVFLFNTTLEAIEKSRVLKLIE